MHVAFVPFTGLRVREKEMLEMGMLMPGLRERAEALAGLPALGLLTLAGMTDEPWMYSYHPSADTETLLEDVLAAKPDLVAVSALTASVLEAYSFCDQLKDYDTPTVIGGLHVTAMPEEAAMHADSVCVGDGESSWNTILEDCRNQCLKRIYRPAKTWNLSDSPMPDFALQGKRSPQRWTIQTQRGCPWACEFCGASRLLGPPRYKPVNRIAAELCAVKKLDRTPWIELADDNTLAGRKDSFELLEEIANANVRYFTESDWRIGSDPKLVRALADSGCVQVLVGIESLNFQYTGMGKKNSDLPQIMDAVDAIQDAGISVNGCFIAGADGETPRSLDAMGAFIRESSLAEVQLTIQTPFPGTGLFRRLNSEGRLLKDRDWSWYTLFDVVFEPGEMTVAELEKGFKRTGLSVFSKSAAKKRNEIRKQVWFNRKR